MNQTSIRLKKREDRRIRTGHPWIFSNEIDTRLSPLKQFTKGQEVSIEAHDQTFLGKAYVNPHSLIAARIFSRDPQAHLDQDFFQQQFLKALALRSRLFEKTDYRFAFSEADGLPGLVIDRFGDDFVIQINTAGMELQKNNIASALCQVIPECRSILLRNDTQIRLQEGLTTYVESLYGHPPEVVSLEENNICFEVSCWSGQKTGWFYDHRYTRALLSKYVPDRRVLDVFSYLGGFGIHAAVYGAKQVDCIDSSKSACEFILRNAKLNEVANKVSVINEEAFIALKALIHSGTTYDVIILDPPAFVKKSKDRRKGIIAYQRLNELGLKLLNQNGILITCSCSMHISMEDLKVIVQRAAAKTHQSIQMLERGHQGPDHPIHISVPETDYLKALVIRKV